MQQGKTELTVPEEVGNGKVGEEKIFPGNTIARLEAVVTQVSSEKYEVTQGKVPTRELFAAIVQGKQEDLTKKGYILRTFKNADWQSGSTDPYSISELWLVVKRIIFDVRRALIKPDNGMVFVVPVFVSEQAVKNTPGKTIGVYYKLPAVAFDTELSTLAETLTPEILIDKTAELFIRLGIKVSTPMDFAFYLIINHYPNKIVERWTMIIPTPPECWEVLGEFKTEIKYLGPAELISYKVTKLIDEITFELALVALSVGSPIESIRFDAKEILKGLKSDYESNFFKGEEALISLKNKILYR